MKQLLMLGGICLGVIALAYTSQRSVAIQADRPEVTITDTVPEKDTTHPKKMKKKRKADREREKTETPTQWPSDTVRVSP